MLFVESRSSEIWCVILVSGAVLMRWLNSLAADILSSLFMVRDSPISTLPNLLVAKKMRKKTAEVKRYIRIGSR